MKMHRVQLAIITEPHVGRAVSLDYPPDDEGGVRAWVEKLERLRLVAGHRAFELLPDPKDARIAELEAEVAAFHENPFGPVADAVRAKDD